jgi:hypothetical protein
MSRAPIKILLQTTIFPTEDDWAIDRLTQLAKLLAAAVGDDGQTLYDVTARDHGPLEAPDPVLSTLDKSHFDQVWLFALDIGDGLTPQDSDAISRFRQAGGGLMVTRDHMDLGSSICTLAGVGAAHFFDTCDDAGNSDLTAKQGRTRGLRVIQGILAVALVAADAAFTGPACPTPRFPRLRERSSTREGKP